MARIETWVDCDLKKIVQVQEVRGNVFTLDNLGNLVGVRVYSDGQPVTLSGSVNGYCILADGTTIPVAGSRSGNTAYIILPQSAYAVPGIIKIMIKLTDSSVITTLAALIGTVYRSRTDTMVDPSSTVIEDWSQQIAASLQECEDVVAQSVKYGSAQSLTDAQKAQARTNIGAPSTATATTSANGLMSSSDKTKLNGIETQANKTLYDTTLSNSGQAADAKTTGDKISDLKSALSNDRLGTIDKSLYNVLDKVFIDYNIEGSAGELNYGATSKCAYMRCLPNKLYSISKMSSQRFRAGYTKEIPAVNSIVYNIAANDAGTAINVITGDDAEYLVIFYYLGSSDTETESTIYDSIRVVGSFLTANDQNTSEIAKLTMDVFGKLGSEIVNRDKYMVMQTGINSSTGALSPQYSASKSVFIECKPNTHYKVSKLADQRFCVGWTTDVPQFGGSCSAFISNNTASKIEITTGENAKYLVVFYYLKTAHTNTDAVLFNSIEIEEGQPNIVIVSKNGLYKTIKDGIDAVSTNGTVFVMPGEYLEQIDTRDKNVNIVGIDKNKCILRDNSGAYATPPLEISGGSVQNMTIMETGSDIPTGNANAYCIHADFDQMENQTLLISNCILRCNKRATIGFGARNGFTLIVENCDIWSGVQQDTTNNPRGAFYGHTQSGTNTTGTDFIMRNNRITCADVLAMCLEDYGGIAIRCDIENNNFYSDINGVANTIIRGINNGDVSFSTTLVKTQRCYGNNVAVLNN
jgi:hypothetical protein